MRISKYIKYVLVTLVTLGGIAGVGSTALAGGSCCPSDKGSKEGSTESSEKSE